jgi:DegV family protein with EDD domain
MLLVTDCAADLPKEEVENLDVKVAPLFIKFPEGEINSDDISPDDFYNRLEAMRPEIPSTAQPSPGLFQDLYAKLASSSKEILSIHVSSGLSGTMNSARLGAAQAAGAAVHLFDSMTLSGGQRFQVLAAAQAIRAGWKLPDILERLQQVRDQTEVVYTLDTLEYLARGGRIGRVQALAGMLLHLKPVIHVDHADGKYSTLGKTRTLGKALDTIGDHLVDKYHDQAVWVSVMHGRFQEQAEALGALLKQRLHIARLETLRISPVLGVHTGPGIVGVAIVPIELMNIQA